MLVFSVHGVLVYQQKGMGTLLTLGLAINTAGGKLLVQTKSYRQKNQAFGHRSSCSTVSVLGSFAGQEGEN